MRIKQAFQKNAIELDYFSQATMRAKRQKIVKTREEWVQLLGKDASEIEAAILSKALMNAKGTAQLVQSLNEDLDGDDRFS